MTTKYTAAEVAKHNKNTDCWIIIDKQVCDVTKFLNDHPGGGEIIMDFAGRDATEDFKGNGHSSSAVKDMKSKVIGVLQ